MITAEQAKEEIDRLKKEARELYLSTFDETYKQIQDKLEASIKVAIKGCHNKTHIILHDSEIIDKLEKECIANGFKVRYNTKERTFAVEW